MRTTGITKTNDNALIQQYLMTNQFQELVNNMRIWAENISDSNPQFLRFLAHLTLNIRWAGIQHNELAAGLIIQKYVEVLCNLKITFNNLNCFSTNLLQRFNYSYIFALRHSNCDEHE